VAEVELPNPEELTEKAERAFSWRVALGAFLTFNGYTLFFRVPFLHH
jgi:hypothetical protein